VRVPATLFAQAVNRAPRKTRSLLDDRPFCLSATGFRAMLEALKMLMYTALVAMRVA
jgi:hypothetical protein